MLVCLRETALADYFSTDYRLTEADYTHHEAKDNTYSLSRKMSIDHHQKLYVKNSAGSTILNYKLD